MMRQELTIISDDRSLQKKKTAFFPPKLKPRGSEHLAHFLKMYVRLYALLFLAFVYLVCVCALTWATLKLHALLNAGR